MRTFRLALALVFGLGGGLAKAGDGTAVARPNLLLIVAEDLGPRVGAFGDPVARTPNLDALAAGGVRFTNVFTTAGVCAPSRAALVTGMHAIAIGAQHMRTGSRPEGGYRTVPPPEVKAFPELLRAAGYHTFTTDKLDYQFSGHAPGSGPFTIWDAEDGTLWEGRDPGQPFFGLVNLLVTHETGVFSPLGTWPNGLLHLGVQLFRFWKFGLPGGDDPTPPGAVHVPPYYPDTPIVRADLARHYDNVRQMDVQVGGVLERLRRDGLADSTIVVWTSDHGDGLPRAKREILDAGVHVPLIVHWPRALRPAGRPPGSSDARLVSFVDLAPTLLALAGAPRPPHLHGRDFLADGAPRRRYVYAARDRIDEVRDRQRLVRDGRWAYLRSWRPGLPGGHPLAFRDNLDLVREMRALHDAGHLDAAQARWFEPVGEERLFDTHADPHQLRDLSGDPAHAAVLERMRRALEAWLDRVGDTSETPEAELAERFWPGGEPPVTPPPTLRLEDGLALAETATPGVSLGVRIGDGRWRLYTRPVPVPPGASIEARAVRYGWKASQTVEADAD